MTQEDKNLLLKELCARLPYGVSVKWKTARNPATVKSVDGEKLIVYREYSDFIHTWDCHIEDIKVYLRPMSSMTEEEEKEEWELWDIVTKTRNDLHYLYTDFLLSHHLDYRGLIEKGLALEAPEGMYKQ